MQALGKSKHETSTLALRENYIHVEMEGWDQLSQGIWGALHYRGGS